MIPFIGADLLPRSNPAQDNSSVEANSKKAFTFSRPSRALTASHIKPAHPWPDLTLSLSRTNSLPTTYRTPAELNYDWVESSDTEGSLAVANPEDYQEAGTRKRKRNGTMTTVTLQNPAMLPSSQSSQTRSTGDREYRLIVEQQPQRARMCGFGDKDRRPITPPPFIRLIVYDRQTQVPLDVNDIDSSFFVLTVDLYNADGSQEVNLVRSQASLPTGSISFAATERYPPPEVRPNEVFVYGAPIGEPHSVALLQERNRQNAHMIAVQTAAQHGQAPPPPPPPPPPQPQATYYPQTPYQQSMGQPGPPMYPQPSYGTNPPAPNPPYPQSWYNPSGGGPVPPPPQTPVSGMFTRNLIGSSAVSANRLTDLNNNLGIWFVFQDLSIRQEGTFKLKFTFMNVGHNGSICTSGMCNVLAVTFSDVIQVFSAKKFPGVFETTELSKCFAHQGIKLPIRKDGPKSSGNADYDADD